MKLNTLNLKPEADPLQKSLAPTNLGRVHRTLFDLLKYFHNGNIRAFDRPLVPCVNTSSHR